MATGYVDSKSYNNARWRLSYTESTSSSGVTKVSYKLITTGREDYNTDTAYTTFCHMKIYDTSWKILAQEDFEWPTTIKSFTGQERATGSFNVYHNSSGVGKFIVTFNVEFYNGTINNPNGQNSESTVTISQISYSYTNCSSPTSVSVSGINNTNFVIPGGTAKVSWSGASNGVSNSISKYRVYWKASYNGDNPTTSDTYQDFSSTSNSGSITIPTSVIRGHIIKFAVRALGSVSGYDAQTITYSSNSVKVNSLPTKPLGGTVSPTLVPASGGTVTFNITSGTDSDGQTVGLKYATSATGTKTACASSFSLSGVSAGTYYFWSNDGLEDSTDYYTVSVSSNTKPTVTIKGTGTQLETVNTLSNATYILNPTITLTKGNDGQQNNNTYNYYIHYSTDNSSWTKKALWENDSSLTKTIDDVRALGYFTNLATTSYYYYFSATRNDGMDTSDAVNTSSTKYYASKRPSLLGMYNTQNYQNIDLSEFQGYFSKALSFKFQRDTGYNSLKIFSGATQVGTISLTAAPDGLRGQWLGINLTKGSYTFTGELGHAANNFYISKLDLGSSYKIENLEAKNLTAFSDFQVYTSGITYDFSIYNTFNVDYPDLTASKYKEYGISDISSSFYAELTVDSVKGNKQALTIVQKTVNGNSTTNDTLYFSLTAAQLYAMLPPISNKNKTYQGILTVGFKDVFETDTNTSINYIINYGATPQVTLCSIKVNNSKEVNTWEYLKEGMPLTVNGTVKSYNSNPKIQIQINRIKDGIESGYVNFGSPIDLASKSSISNITPSQGAPTSYTFSNQKIITIGELIELNYQVNFRVKVITDADSKYHYTGSKLYAGNVKVCGHTSQGAVTLNEADYSSTEITRAISYLNYRYTNNHPGALIITDNSNYKLDLVAKLQYRDITESDYLTNNMIDTGLNTAEYFKEQSGQKRQIIFSFPENADAFVCRLVITTTQTVYNGTESYATTKIVYTNEQAVYNILPTVSYRKNLLGINATNLNREELKNAVLVIGEHSSKNIIYLISSTGVKKINTSTGELDGFILDCGSW